MPPSWPQTKAANSATPPPTRNPPQRLAGYAVSGHNDGGHAGDASGLDVSFVGRLPSEDARPASPLHDGDGGCLWYAVSATKGKPNQADVSSRDTPGRVHRPDAVRGKVLTGDLPYAAPP